VYFISSVDVMQRCEGSLSRAAFLLFTRAGSKTKTAKKWPKSQAILYIPSVGQPPRYGPGLGGFGSRAGAPTCASCAFSKVCSAWCVAPAGTARTLASSRHVMISGSCYLISPRQRTVPLATARQRTPAGYRGASGAQDGASPSLRGWSVC
jgi:hypothetical protein